MIKSDFRIDILRFIGISCIILAHVKPPELIHQLRNFDVPLMVILTGTSYALNKEKERPSLKYIYKRFNKLIFFTWKFLIFFFIAFFLLSLIFHFNYPFSKQKIVDSFMFNGGIDYLWILPVFLFISICFPLLSKFDK